MIDLKECYDLITSAFHKTQNVFHWGDNAIFEGSLEHLPAPEIIQEFSEGDYFAVVDASSITPIDVGNAEITEAQYHYSLILCRKGKTGDITKIRSDIVNKFAAGWYEFWREQGAWTEETTNIFTRVDEIENDFDVIAVSFVGAISHITTKRGTFYG